MYERCLPRLNDASSSRLVRPRMSMIYCACAVQDAIIALQEEQSKGSIVGLDIETGEPMDPSLAGLYDNYIVKRQILQSAPIIANQLLLVDEVLRAGANMRRGPPGG